VVSDLAEDLYKPALRIEFIHLGDLDEGKGNRHRFAAAFRSRKNQFLSAQAIIRRAGLALLMITGIC